MAYDEQLADRVRAALAERTDFEEKKMFGGLAFMVNTHMACGMIRDDLMIRVGKDHYDEALGRGAQPMQMGERVMRGMVMVPGPDVAADDALAAWMDQAVAIARAEPPKPPKGPKKPKKP
jgi:TfoX/Sxy family transcriptional regulator of competence genes